MANTDASFRRTFRAGLLSCLLCMPIALGCGYARAGSPMTKKTSTWTQYHDPRFQFNLEHPMGWTVHADEHSILIQSADQSAFSLVENFTPNDGQDAPAHIATVLEAESALMPQATINRQTPLGTSNGEVAALSYQGANGPGSARILCRITNGNGLLFAMAAPSARFDAERATLLRILTSLKFETPAAAGHKTSVKPAAPLTMTPASLRYVNWKDPNEAAFKLEVPQGWDVQGGLFHVAVSDSRMMVMAHSPQAGVTILLSDTSIPTFTEPNSLILQEGYKIGAPFTMNGNSKSILYDYMPAQDFNHWYLQTHLSLYVDDVQVAGDKDRPDMVTAAEAILAKGPMGSRTHTVTASETTFTGRDKATGQPISGAIISRTTDFPLGQRFGGGTWSAVPNLYVYTADSHQSARKAIALAAMSHMSQTMQLDPGWAQRDQMKQQQVLQEIQREGAEVLQQRYEQYTAQADAKRQEINENFLEHLGIKAEGQRQEMNYIGSTADVVNPNTGQATKVPAGFTHYNQDEKTGAITGTDDPAGAEDRGLTPLTKF